MAEGKDPGEILIAMQNGLVLVADLSVAAPVSEAAAFAAGWEDLGYVEETGGVKIGAARTNKEIGAWTELDPVKMFQTARVLLFSFGLRQWDGETLTLAFGGGTISQVSSGHFKYEFPDANVDERQLAIKWQAEGFSYLIIVPKGAVTENVDTTLTHTDNAVLPIGFRALKKDAASKIAYLLTDDPAFSPAGS